MNFGTIPVDDAAGAILAHAVVAGEQRYRKAHRITADDVAAMRAAGIGEVIAARLDEGDLDENAAATAIAEALDLNGVEARPAATGRVNLHAGAAGVFDVDAGMIDAVNRLDPTVTIATLARHTAVSEGQMVATIKIIPFAVPGSLVETAATLARDGGAMRVHAFSPLRVALIHTTLPGLKKTVIDKTGKLTAERLARSASTVTEERLCAHEAAALAPQIADVAEKCDMIIVFGASAMSDPDDVIPAALKSVGGKVLRVGMPVDPGNLLVLGYLGEKPVIGAPGCARSPKINGFDWVLDRLVAGLSVSGDDIAGMGVGGLLTEIPTRPQPREMPRAKAVPKVGAILLAAGQSSRMGEKNKLLARFDGQPLVRRVATELAASRIDRIVAVTGHQSDRIREALAGLDLTFADNPDYASGLASSLKAGIGNLPPDMEGALVVLGDMPEISAGDLDRLIEAFRAEKGRAIVRATHGGKRGNPVILPRALFPEIGRLTGDTGARHLVESAGAGVIDVEIGAAASVDVDTPEAMSRAGGVLAD